MQHVGIQVSGGGKSFRSSYTGLYPQKVTPRPLLACIQHTRVFIITGGFAHRFSSLQAVSSSSLQAVSSFIITGGFIIRGGRPVQAVSSLKVVNDAACRHPGEHRRLLVCIHHMSCQPPPPQHVNRRPPKDHHWAL